MKAADPLSIQRKCSGYQVREGTPRLGCQPRAALWGRRPDTRHDPDLLWSPWNLLCSTLRSQRHTLMGLPGSFLTAASPTLPCDTQKPTCFPGASGGRNKQRKSLATHRLVVLVELQVVAAKLHTEDDGRDALEAVDPLFAL